MKKKIRLTISIFSIIIIITSILISIQKGLFHGLFQELRENHNIIGTDTVIENAVDGNGQEFENQTGATASESSTQPTKLATYDEKLFYHVGDDIYYSLLPSRLKGEMVVGVSDVFISRDMRNVQNTQIFTERQKLFPNDYNNVYFITLIVHFENVGATRVSWSVGDFGFASFKKNSQVNGYDLAMSATNEAFIVDGSIDINHGEFFLESGESCTIQYTGMVLGKLVDDAIAGNTELYFAPSNMYTTAPNKENALAFIELDVSNIN